VIAVPAACPSHGASRSPPPTLRQHELVAGESADQSFYEQFLRWVVCVWSALFPAPAHKQLLKPDNPDKPLPPRMGKRGGTVSRYARRETPCPACPARPPGTPTRPQLLGGQLAGAALLVPPPRPVWRFQRAREALEAVFVALLACCPAGKPFQGQRPAGRLSDTKALDPLRGPRRLPAVDDGPRIPVRSVRAGHGRLSLTVSAVRPTRTDHHPVAVIFGLGAG
jgi:hypothetical protein